VRDVSRVCNAVATGDLTQKITVPVQGDLMVQLKKVINTMVDNLGHFATEVTRGKLGAQAHVEDVEGTWRELTDEVNTLAANLTTQNCKKAKPLFASLLVAVCSRHYNIQLEAPSGRVGCQRPLNFENFEFTFSSGSSAIPRHSKFSVWSSTLVDVEKDALFGRVDTLSLTDHVLRPPSLQKAFSSAMRRWSKRGGVKWYWVALAGKFRDARQILRRQVQSFDMCSPLPSGSPPFQPSCRCIIVCSPRRRACASTAHLPAVDQPATSNRTSHTKPLPKHRTKVQLGATVERIHYNFFNIRSKSRFQADTTLCRQVEFFKCTSTKPTLNKYSESKLQAAPTCQLESSNLHRRQDQNTSLPSSLVHVRLEKSLKT
ncbi:hypothetical protein B0H16DRAFT_1834390, partial [Mycena metata]